MAVFPAYAGMSPQVYHLPKLWYRFPRIRGDEPRISYSQFLTILFSPHTRG